MALTPESFRRSPYLLGSLMLATALLTIFLVLVFVS